MIRRKPVIEQPFLNEWGHTINVGDEVIVITKSTGHVGINFGKYLGYRELKQYGADYKTTSVAINDFHTKSVHNVTGEEYVGWTSGGKYPEGYPKCPSFDYGLKWKSPEYQAAQVVYNQEMQVWVDFHKNNFHDIKIPYVRYTTLQLNMILPGSTSLRELAEKAF